MLPPFTSPATGATFQYLAGPGGQAEAEAACNRYGGHLATYTSLPEQVGCGHCCMCVSQ